MRLGRGAPWSLGFPWPAFKMLGLTVFRSCKCGISQDKLTFHNNDSLECHILKHLFSWVQRPKIATLYLKDSLTHICRVENLSKICRFLSWKSVQGCVENLSKILFCLCFPPPPPNFIVFSGYLKNHKQGGCENIFGQFVSVSKKGFLKIMCTFCFCIFMLEKVKRKIWKTWKRESPENSVFWVVMKKNGLFCIGKHYLCSDGKKSAFSLQLSVLGKWSFFVAIPSDKTL